MRVKIKVDLLLENKAEVCITGMSNAQATALFGLLEQGYLAGRNANPDEELVYDEIMQARAILPDKWRGLISE